jgi:hypothetical protein
MHETFDSLKHFVVAYTSIMQLLDSAIETWPQLPEGWDRYDEHLDTLHSHGPATAALLVRHGRESAADARRYVAAALEICVTAKAAMARYPYWFHLDLHRQMRDRVGQLAAPLLQLLAMIEDELRTGAAGAAEGGGGEARPRRSPNEERDRFCYEQKCAGMSWKGIRQAVNGRPDWEPIDTDQGLSQAAKRYAERHNKPWPISD